VLAKIGSLSYTPIRYVAMKYVKVFVFSPTMTKGSVELLVLSTLESEPRHGYDIGKRIETLSGGRLHFRVSSLYPILCRMEERGWIAGRWVERPGLRRRRYYRLTAKGREALTEQRETWDAFTTLNMAVAAPIPNPSVRAATIV